jgi:tetratricopeptide (TPR) repeat protein
MIHVRAFACALLFCAAASAQTLVEQAYDDMYNLRFDDAHRTLAAYETAHPNDPLGPVSDAAACLFSEFERLHILESQFFTDDNAVVNGGKRQPDPAVRARFEEDLKKTDRLAEAQLHTPGEHANAMFAATMRLGLDADYLALIDGRNLAALSEMKKARQLAEQLLSEDPKYYDAYIAVGTENYILSLKAAPVRWLLHLTGAETDKQNGLDKLRLTAKHGHYLLPYARLLLAVAALRDGDRKKARELLQWLGEKFPQNHLYRSELAKLG